MKNKMHEMNLPVKRKLITEFTMLWFLVVQIKPTVKWTLVIVRVKSVFVQYLSSLHTAYKIHTLKIEA